MRPRPGAIRFLFAFLSSFGLTVSAHAAGAGGDLEHYVHRLVNEHRRTQGRKPLAFSPEIAAIARRHSRDMAAGRVGYGHGGIESRRQAVAGFIGRTGTAENVHTIRNHESPALVAEKAVAGWVESPGHRRNIEGSYDLAGIGIARGERGRYFFTQFFVRTAGYQSGTYGNDPRPSPAPAWRESKPTPPPAPAVSARATQPAYSYEKPPRRRRPEKDPRRRPRRRRTADGWVQKLE